MTRALREIFEARKKYSLTADSIDKKIKNLKKVCFGACAAQFMFYLRFNFRVVGE